MLSNQFEEFDTIQEEIRKVYLKDYRPFIVLFSTGKDSSLVLLLVWKMLASLAPEARHKPVHVITSDTKVETPSFTHFVTDTLENIRQEAKAQGLPIEVHFAQPRVTDSFLYQVIGKGNPPPTRTSMKFRWCTDKLKIVPVDRVVMDILEETPLTLSYDQYDVLMLLGVREDESTSRKQSIQKFALNDKFARHAKYDRVLVYHPIKFVQTDTLWPYLMSHDTFPWGVKSSTLYSIYRNSSQECPMTQIEGKQHSSCGGGRMGCWTCAYVGKHDKMLINLIDSGETDLIPLLEFKQTLYDMIYDIRYREPLRRKMVHDIMKPHPDMNAHQTELFSRDFTSAYGRFKRADNWEFQSGPITLEGRKMLLGMLLDAEQRSGHELISRQEVDEVVRAWSEDGYSATEEDLQPKQYNYPGPLLFTPDARINEKTSKNPNSVFAVWEDFDNSLDKVVSFLKERSLKTGKHLYHFMQCVDYRRDFDMTEQDPVLNRVQFIVCEEGISTQDQAKAYVEEWLGYNEVNESMDWQTFGQRMYQQTLDYAHSKNVALDTLSRYNKTLKCLGFPPVEASAPFQEQLAL